jgi:hypothetical protein
VIDRRFLRLHPATEAWWVQRQQCALCSHCQPSSGPEGEQIMRCGVTTNKGPRGTAYCIDTRLPSGACGPEGRLFQPKPG